MLLLYMDVFIIFSTRTVLVQHRILVACGSYRYRLPFWYTALMQAVLIPAFAQGISIVSFEAFTGRMPYGPRNLFSINICSSVAIYDGKINKYIS